jgi:hypothetical protein
VLELVEYPPDNRPFEAALESHMAEMVDHHRHVFDQAQQIGIVEQVIDRHCR